MTEYELIQAISIRAELTMEAAGRAYQAMQEIMLQALEDKESLPVNNIILQKMHRNTSELSLV